MVKVSIEVPNGAVCFVMPVQAESIWRTVSFIAERYPRGDARLKVSTDLGGFFVRELATRPELATTGQLEANVVA